MIVVRTVQLILVGFSATKTQVIARIIHVGRGRGGRGRGRGRVLNTAGHILVGALVVRGRCAGHFRGGLVAAVRMQVIGAHL